MFGAYDMRHTIRMGTHSSARRRNFAGKNRPGNVCARATDETTGNFKGAEVHEHSDIERAADKVRENLRGDKPQRRDQSSEKMFKHCSQEVCALVRNSKQSPRMPMANLAQLNAHKTLRRGFFFRIDLCHLRGLCSYD